MKVLIRKINRKYKNVLELFEKLRKQSFISFMISSTISRAMSFLSVIFLAKFFSKTDYGILSYVDNLRSYFLLLNGMGMTNVVLRYCVQEKDQAKAKGYYLAAFKVGLIFDLVLILISMLFFGLMPMEFASARFILFIMILLPGFIYVFEILQISFRATFQNNLYSKVSIIYSILMILLQVIFCINYGLVGVAVGRYSACIFSIVIALFYYRKSPFYGIKSISPPKAEIKQMVKLGISLLIASAASSFMIYNETYILGKITNSADALADYKVASLVLQITYFVVSSINLFIFPIFARNYENKIWVWKNFKLMTKYLCYIMIPLHIGLIVFAKYFIIFVFGTSYLTAIHTMRILLIASLFQTIVRMPVGTILVAIGKERFNLIINSVSMIVHIGVNIFIISIFGGNGAGVSIAIIYGITAVIMCIALKKSCIPKSFDKYIE